ncbi:MAG: hypothetical protein ACFCU6_16500 [Balneolaceae bacterium]
MRISDNISILAFLLLFLAAGCLLFDEVRTAERVLVENRELPAVEFADILQSSVNFNPQIPQIASRLEKEADIDRSTWSIPVQQALGGYHAQQEGQFRTETPGSGRQHTSGFGGTPVPADNEIILTEHLNRITSQAKRAEWRGRVFYFISVAVDTPGSEHSGVQFESTDYEDPARFHRVYALDEASRGVTFFDTDEVEPVYVAGGLPRSLPGQPLQFNVIVLDEGPAVIYRDRDGIYLRPLNFHGRRVLSAASSGSQSFSFDKRHLIADAETPYGRFQLISRLDQKKNIHLIWTDSREKYDLWYCKYKMETGEVCNEPEKIARTASAAPVNLMLQNDDIYISWIDNRYTQGFWSPKNFAKLLLVKSEDGGNTFGSPVAVNPPRDQEDNVAYSVIMPAPDEGVLVFWGTKAIGTGAKNQDLFYGWLDGELGTLYLGRNKFPGNRLQEIVRENVLAHHRTLGNF